VRQIVVAGKPDPMPRARFNRQTGFAYTPKDARLKKGAFTDAWLEAGHGMFDRDTPLRCEVEATFPRPASHFGTGKNAGLLKDRFVSARPGGGQNGGDVDNLAKLPIDALEGIAFGNDSQIAELTVVKRYVRPGEVPFTRIALAPIDP